MSRKIALEADYSNDGTLIPNTFFDQYLPKANGEFLKIYLYLLRWMPVPGHTISLSSIADFFEMTESDVMRALRYWEKARLLCMVCDEMGEIISIRINYLKLSAPGASAAPDHTAQEAAVPSGENEAVPAALSQPKRSYTMSQIQEFQEKGGGEELLFIIQKYLGRTLSPMDLNTIMYFHDGLGFSVELIEYLFEYCVSADHKDMRYIEKVALAWKDRHVETVEDARTQGRTHQRLCYEVLKVFGITGRQATPDEADLITRWHKAYGFSQEMILEACRRTMNAIHKPEFNYVDKILSSWKEAGAFTMTEVMKLDKAFTMKKSEAAEKEKTAKPASRSPRTKGNRFNNFTQRTYNYSDLEKKLAQKVQEAAGSDAS